MKDLNEEQLIAALREIEVPEPPAGFWDQLSDRVHEAVAAEERRGGIGPWLSTWWTLAPFAAAAAAIVVAALYFGAPAAGPSIPGEDAAAPVADVVPLPPLGDQNDPSLAIVASLASEVDASAALESGLVTHAGGLDDAVSTLTDTERAELGRILKDEIAKS